MRDSLVSTAAVLFLVAILGAASCDDDAADEAGPEPTAGEEATGGVELTMRLSEVKNTEGKLRILLYNDEKAWQTMKPEKAFRRLVIEVPDGDPRDVVLTGIPAGTYGVFLHHDLDDDGELDTRFFIPTEGLACSNGARGGMSGGPKWQDARFEIPDEETFVLPLRVAYPAD